MARLRREISIMETLNHPGIVRLYRVVETDTMVALVLEFMPGFRAVCFGQDFGFVTFFFFLTGGELCDLIKLHHTLPEHVARRFFVQLLHAVHYLHSKGFVHRDIKCKNIMLSGEDSMELQHVYIFSFLSFV